MGISDNINKLLKVVEGYKKPSYLCAEDNDSIVEVGKIASHAAHYYEKVRYAVDYKEEDVLQRSAIERILKRKITFGSDTSKIGEDLIIELIQAGYLPNGELPQRVVDRVQLVIDKAVLFMNSVRKFDPNLKNVFFDSKVIGLVACEIEDLLFPSVIEEATADTFYNYIKDRVDVVGLDISQNELDIQVYLASHKSLLKRDNTRLFYSLWKIYYPEWEELDISSDKNIKNIKDIAEDFLAVKKHFEEQLEHPVQFKLLSKLKNDVIYFSTILMLLKRHKGESRELFSNYDSLVSEVENFISSKYKIERKKVDKMVWRAIFYIFATKIILAFLIELPYDLLVEKQVQYLALGINVVFHPLLLFAITRNVHVGDHKNTNIIVEGVSQIVYGSNHKKISLKFKKSKSFFFYFGSLLYATLFLISFGIILIILNSLNFNIVGMSLFILFLALVSFFGLRIRYIARSWLVRTNDERFFIFLWDLLTLPVVSLGRWLTYKFSSINIFVFIMDFVIEMPFKAVLRVFDSFVLYIKEKKEELS